MSKHFKSQDYFRYPKLKKRWRKPVGLQSKLRLKNGGSGMRPAIGYGSPPKPAPALIRSMGDFEKDCSNGIIFSSMLGSRKTALLAAKAKDLGLTVANMKKVRRASKLQAHIKKRKESLEKKKEKFGKGKIGFYDGVVPQVLDGKTKTYRLRDHGLKAGDEVVFENTQKKEVFGHAKITKAEKSKVGEIDLKDPAHHRTYDKAEELIEAFKKHYPEKDVTPETDAWVYTYEFTPSKQDDKKGKK